MHTNQLRCFVTVADQLNYRRAAELLSYSASHVSQQISQLEVELGIILFERSTHHVALTPAGRQLLSEARDFLLAEARVRESASGIRSGISARIKILYSSGSGTIASSSVRAFKAQHPATEVVLTQLSTRQMHEEVRNGAAGVGFALSTLHLATGLSCLAMHDYRQDHLAVPVDHPLADREQLTVYDLQGQRLLLPSPDMDATHGTRILDFLTGHGIVADHRFQPFGSEEEVVDIVSAGLGVVFVGESTWLRWGSVPEIRIRKLEGAAPSLSQLMVWRDEDPSPATRAFVRVARTISASHPGTPATPPDS
jgi:DNA-binding transcriptional LysR family regulator